MTTDPLPATIIGGYLGAGKTTLVNNLLRNANGRRLAILVNEFGALPIDEDLIEAQGDDMIAISGGCICCSFGSDLTAALMQMAQLTPRPDHVLIEASGVAMPGAIAASIAILENYQLSGVVVLADGETVLDLAENEYLGDTIQRQLVDADLILVTKTDLCTAAQTAHLRDWLGRINTKAPILQPVQGEIDIDIVLGAAIVSLGQTITDHADGDYQSHFFPLDEPICPNELAAALSNGDFGIIRAKGFVLDRSGTAHLIQMVGKRVEVSPTEQATQFDIICIGLTGKLDLERLQKLFTT
ncbi:MAG: CobW family GTP-binding protein [Planktomarina sp.]